MPSAATIRPGSFLPADLRMPVSAKDFNLAGSTRDSALRQFRYTAPSAKMPRATSVPTDELGKLQNVIRKAMVLSSRSGWVDTALVRSLDALPVLEEGRMLDPATFSMLRAMLVDHGRDQTTMAELLCTAYGNLQLMLRDQAITTLKEGKPEASSSSKSTSSKTPLAHVPEVDWIKLRASALFTPDLFAQPQVDQLLEGVVAQDKKTVEMAAVMKTVAASSRPGAPTDSRKRKATGRASGAPPSKKPQIRDFHQPPARNTRSTPTKPPLFQLRGKQAQPQPSRQQPPRQRGHSKKGRNKKPNK